MYDAVDLLRTTLFTEVDQVALARFAERGRRRYLSSGDILIREGAAADTAYVLLSGRLRVSISGPEGEEVVGEVTGGQIVGEMALVTERSRSTTVRATRESTVLEFGADAFRALIQDDPTALLAVTGMISRRLESANPGTRMAPTRRTIAVIAARAMGSGFADTADALCRAMTAGADTYVVKALPTDYERDMEGVVRRLHELETAHRFVVYVADDPASPFGRLSARQADHILIVDDSVDSGSGEAIAPLGASTGTPTGPSVDVVVVHDPSTSRPSGAERWVDRIDGVRVHHIRRGSARDHARLGRVLAGRDVSIVLSGGGARGYAHLGVLRALEEAGVAVDAIGGSSFGSVVGGAYALLESWEAVRDALRRSLVDTRGPVDKTLPVTSLARGDRLRTQLEDTFAQARIENLWLRFFCVSTDLTAKAVRVHTTGPCSLAVRASVSIPGVFPPMVGDDGHVLVDGSVMNTLPLDVMDAFAHGGPSLAVNLRSSAGLASTGLATDGVLSGWKALVGRFVPSEAGSGPPGIIDVLLRSTEAGATSQSQHNEALADWVFHPPVHDYPLMDFEALDALVDVGYKHAIEQLEAIDGSGSAPWTVSRPASFDV